MSARSYRARSHRSETSSSSSSSRSYASDHSRSTAPTIYSDRPMFVRHDTSPANLCHHGDRSSTRDEPEPRASVETYASTIASTEDLIPQPEYELPLEREQVFSSTSIPTIPSEFAELFEAGRRIHIEHDNSTSDGNMNLCLDTEISVSGQRRKMTLFHLRMRDLRDRQFSLRRHCRDSGREVCKSSRKYGPVRDVRKPSKRPALQRSLSSAISSLMGGKERENARSGRRGVRDNSSEAFDGFPSLSSDSSDDLPSRNSRPTVPTNTIRLEFSNYALVKIHASGTKSAKQYDFEYWGSQYYWKRQVRRDGHMKATSYHLINAISNEAIAHITPEPLTRRQAMEEEYRGGWVPPCSLFITDQKAFSTDLADVIVATGLVALVDDCITRRWHSKGGMVLNIPTKNSDDYITPQRLIDDIFNRRGHTMT
jgi:hypothetical protein